MRRLIRFLFVLALFSASALSTAYYLAGRYGGAQINIQRPSRVVGQSGTLELTVEATREELDSLAVRIEQKGQAYPVFVLDRQNTESLQPSGPDTVRVVYKIDTETMPDLQPGPATIVAAASVRVLRGLRTVPSEARRDVQVRLDPPRISVVSTHHYINQGGSELVVYRVSPPDVRSGVRVGDVVYPGFPASGAGVRGGDTLKVAFFALLYNQAPSTGTELFAEDEAGNQARAQFEHRVFPKAFRRSRIEVDDAFLGRVIPAILPQARRQLKPVATSGSGGNLLPAFLEVNGDLRRVNANTIAELGAKTSPAMLWKGAFRQLGNSQVESGFADYRTYFYKGREIDQQVHLGFDLAVTANVPVLAANSGKVIYAQDLGIYGNTVILDHGLGVQSLYAHLSSFDVAKGQDVQQGQVLGRTGQTGLAGGDHLHFTMLVSGHAVDPTEWWDPHWIEDRIVRKLREADTSGSRPTPGGTAQRSAPSSVR